MRTTAYKDFSLRAHLKGQRAQKPTCCQFELTFSCGLHCRHCYTDCYNRKTFIKKELNTVEVKKIIDKIREIGVIWLCFTGGDPLSRKDFPEIYAYARRKGFLVTVFTSGYHLNSGILEVFKHFPLFALEMTLNAVEERLFERISRVKGSFAKVMESMQMILKERIPLKVKTLVTRDNQSHVPEIKKFLKGHGLVFRPDYHLFARLNKDVSPCVLRISPGKAVSLFRERFSRSDVCSGDISGRTEKNKLFHCVLENGEEFHIDPYGRMFVCQGVRSLGADALQEPLEPSFNKLISIVRQSRFLSDSKCATCAIRENCFNCPGRAYLETSDMEAPSKYYCELTKRIIKQ